MKEIKIMYLDWWQGFDCENYLINKILRKHYDIRLSDKEPDYVIGSVYAKEALNYNCVRIFYSGENFCPDFNLYDYAIGFERMSYGDRYAYMPNYVINPKYADDIKEMLIKHTKESISKKNKTGFCSYVVSNGNADPIRAEFFERLSEYKKVASGGRYQNNINLPDGVPDKYEFQKKFKFSICFENSSNRGYITEKLIQGFAAGTVPIYWGAPDVCETFNKNAMVVISGRKDIPNAIEKIKEIDNDETLYQSMLAQPALVRPNYITDLKLDLEKFLLNIFEQPLGMASRRPCGNTVRAYYGQNESKKQKIRCIKNIIKKSRNQAKNELSI